MKTVCLDHRNIIEVKQDNVCKVSNMVSAKAGALYFFASSTMVPKILYYFALKDYISRNRLLNANIGCERQTFTFLLQFMCVYIYVCACEYLCMYPYL